jgi:hypothetical protein
MEMRLEPGTTLVFDRGYYRFGWWLRLTRRGIFFVGRLKENGGFLVVRENLVPEGTRIRKDEVVVAPGQKRSGEDAYFRRIELYDERSPWPRSRQVPPAKVLISISPTTRRSTTSAWA